MYAANESYEHVARRSYWKPGQSASAIKHDPAQAVDEPCLKAYKSSVGFLMASVQCV